jgi:hypothetical protein
VERGVEHPARSAAAAARSLRERTEKIIDRLDVKGEIVEGRNLHDSTAPGKEG